MMLQTAPGKSDRLVTHAQYRWVFQSKAEDIADLPIIDSMDDGDNQHSVDAGLGQVVQRLSFNGAQVTATQCLVRFGAHPIELKVDEWPIGRQCVRKIRLSGQPQPVGIEHYVTYIAITCGGYNIQDLRV